MELAEAEFPICSSMAWVDLADLDPQPAVGWTYKNGVFTAPPDPTEEEIISATLTEVEVYIERHYSLRTRLMLQEFYHSSYVAIGAPQRVFIQQVFDWIAGVYISYNAWQAHLGVGGPTTLDLSSHDATDPHFDLSKILVVS